MSLDLLIVNAPSRQGVYQALSAFAAVEPPVWALLIAARVKDLGYSVEVMDAEARELSPASAAHIATKMRPKLIAYAIYGHQPSASTQCMPAAIEMMKCVKASCDIPQLAFGTHPSALPKETLHEGFDYVVQGEGLHEITILLANMQAIKKPGGVFSVPGLWHSGCLPPGAMSLIANLDGLLPRQAFELVDMTYYRPLFWHKWTAVDRRTFGYASVQTSLGCPFRCSFCCINTPFGGPGFRTWSPYVVVDQIEHLVKKYGITNIKIPDEMFVLNPKHVAAICFELLKRKLGQHLNMWAYARIDTVKDERMLALMRQAGFRWLGIGIESASAHVRDGIEKGRFGDDSIITAIDRVRSAGLHVGANYIFGLPDDTKASMRDTLQLAIHLSTEHANFYCAMAYPGSKLHADARKMRLPLPESHGPGWIGYSQHAYESFPMGTAVLSREEVLDFRDNAFMKYHTGPKYLHTLMTTFGQHAVDDMAKITALGLPSRKHRREAVVLKGGFIDHNDYLGEDK